MFFCEPCRQRNKWPISWAISFGPCEVCGKKTECYDVPSKHLPDPPAEQQAPAREGETK